MLGSYSWLSAWLPVVVVVVEDQGKPKLAVCMARASTTFPYMLVLGTFYQEVLPKAKSNRKLSLLPYISISQLGPHGSSGEK